MWGKEMAFFRRTGDPQETCRHVFDEEANISFRAHPDVGLVYGLVYIEGRLCKHCRKRTLKVLVHGAPMTVCDQARRWKQMPPMPPAQKPVPSGMTLQQIIERANKV